jgi:hypothetical protein
LLYILAAVQLLFSFKFIHIGAAIAGYLALISVVLLVVGGIAVSASAKEKVLASKADSFGGVSDSLKNLQPKHKLQWGKYAKTVPAVGVICFALAWGIAAAQTLPDHFDDGQVYYNLEYAIPAGWSLQEVDSPDDGASFDAQRGMVVKLASLGVDDWDAITDDERASYFDSMTSKTIGTNDGVGEPSEVAQISGHPVYGASFKTEGAIGPIDGEIFMTGGKGSLYAVVAYTANANDVKDKATIKKIPGYFNLDPATVTASFYIDKDHKLAVQGEDYGSGAVVEAPESPTRDGYAFSGWCLNDDVSAELPQHSISVSDQPLVGGVHDGDLLVPSWRQLHTVTFTDGFDNVISQEQVAEGFKASAPDKPKRDGYEFAGWDTSFMFVVSDLTVNAKWTRIWVVTFTDGSGKTLKTDKVRDGEAAVAPNSPTKSGYDFKGWDTDYSAVTSNLTVNATWKAKPTKADLNAVKQAKSYIRYQAFSYSGLIKQLKYEGYTDEQATYGADNCGADWYEQAAKCAKSYLKYSSFSRSGLINQLEFEGFSSDEATYGVDQAGL